MMSKAMEKMLNEQVNAELYSSYLYLSMSACFAERNLKGMAHWLRAQAGEEYGHGMKILDFLVERGASVKLMDIKSVPASWATPLAAFKQVRAHEAKVTGMINKIMDLAIKEKDYATQEFLNWFIKEQVEEESSAEEILQKLNLIGDAVPGLMFLDSALGQRK